MKTETVFPTGAIRLLLMGSVFFTGCAGTPGPFAARPNDYPILADSADFLSAVPPVPVEEANYRLKSSSLLISQLEVAQPVGKFQTIQPVSHVPNELFAPPVREKKEAILTIDGKTYRVQLTEDLGRSPTIQIAADNRLLVPPSESEAASANSYPLDLPSALSLIGGQHPAIGLAQWKVQEAYANLDKAEVLWLPSLQTGFSFHRHDGNYQASNGEIVDVNRSSFQYGFGAGTTGAGTTPRPGLVAQFHLADAIFEPEIAEKKMWAQGHAANGVYQKQLLNVALGYLDLLKAEQDLKILEESRTRTTDLAKLTEDFAATGQGLRADADRMKTEQILIESRIVEIREQSDVASSKLAQTLSLEAGRRIVPMDPTVIPIDLVSPGQEISSLISAGLSQRPELKETQALVSVACEKYQQQKYRPFVPSVLLGFSTSGFGGGVGSNIDDVDGRYDIDALMTWEIRNLGLGEKANRRETSAKIQQAKYEKIRVLDQVAREITEAHSQVVHRANRIEITRGAIQFAQDSYDRNVSRIRDGQGLPIEVLQSVRALEDTKRAYLNAVIDYNTAQFKLQWSLGWPIQGAFRGSL